MKTFKKVLALALALALALSLSMPVFAYQDVDLPAVPDPGTGTPSANTPKEDHTYTAYQIFTGETGTVDNKTALVEINWGNAIANPEAFIKSLKKNNDFIPEEGAANVFAGVLAYDENHPKRSADSLARVVADLGEDTDLSRAFARAVYDQLDTENVQGVSQNSKVDPGYYLVVDTEDASPVRNLSVLSFVTDGSFNPEMKVEVPQLDKWVLEVNDSQPQGEAVGAWGEVADHDVGDAVPFALVGTIPTGYKDYETYKYVFHDTLSDGLKFNEDVKVYVKTGAAEPILIDSRYYEVQTTGIKADESFNVVFDDLKNLPEEYGITAGSVIQVTYTAIITEGAEHFMEDNTAYLEFSNDPNARGDGNNPPPTGNTPDDKVTVFTFKLIANKVDNESKELFGATFELLKKTLDDNGNAVYTSVGVIESTEEDPTSEFKFAGLDAGEYKLVEVKAPAGYNKAEDMYFTVESVYDGQDLKELKIGSIKDSEGKTLVSDVIDGSVTITGDKESGELKADIVNLQGVLLPSTGGIGTTIFYLVGGLCVAAAVVLLITKKRMGKAE